MARGALLRRLVRARDLLHAEAARNPTLEDLAEAAGLSRAHLARNFTQTFGVSPHQYLVQLRLDQARRALAAGTSVTEVCRDVGFESLGTFSTTFRKRVGLSPREYQRRARPFVQSLGVPILYIPSCFLYAAHV
jgi:AraC-like DNA-binding protein